MPLAAIANGNATDASQINQLINLLTGVMTDQPVTLNGDPPLSLSGQPVHLWSNIVAANSFQRYGIGYGVYWSRANANYTIDDPTFNQSSFTEENGIFTWTMHSGALTSPQTYAQWSAYVTMTLQASGALRLNGGGSTAAPGTTAQGASLWLDDTANNVNSGGAVLFGGRSGTFHAGWKSLLQDGTTNTVGDLAAYTRRAVGDASLTESLRILQSGGLRGAAWLALGGTEPFTPNVGDLIVNRGGASPGTGVVYFGSSVSSHYVYYDGTKFIMTDPLQIGGALTGATSATFSGTLQGNGLQAKSQLEILRRDTNASAWTIYSQSGNLSFWNGADKFTLDTTNGNLTLTAGLSGITTLSMSGALSGATTGLFSGDLRTSGGRLIAGTDPGGGAAGDVIANRGGGSPGTGVVYFGSSGGSHYLYYDGSKLNLPDILDLNSHGLQGVTSLAIAGAFSGATTGSFSGRVTTTSFLADGGTSFPASPSTNDQFYRTDVKLNFFYDGTRWLTTELFIFPLSMSFGTTVNTSTSQAVPALPTGTTDIWLVDHVIQTFVSTTNNGLNFWANTLTKYIVNNTGTNIDTAISTVSDTLANWTKHVTAINALLFNGTTYYDWNENWTKSGSPGQLIANAYITFRFVAT